MLRSLTFEYRTGKRSSSNINSLFKAQMEKDAKSFVDLTSPSAHGYMTKVDSFKEIYDKVEKASSLLRS